MDSPALTKLYETYGYLVHRRCGAILQNPTDAEDALQEVFFRVQRTSTRPQPGKTLPWLYAIAFAVCTDMAKDRNRERATAPEDLNGLDARTSGNAADADHRAIVGAALRRVGPKTR